LYYIVVYISLSVITKLRLLIFFYQRKVSAKSNNLINVSPIRCRTGYIYNYKRIVNNVKIFFPLIMYLCRNVITCDGKVESRGKPCNQTNLLCLNSVLKGKSKQPYYRNKDYPN